MGLPNDKKYIEELIGSSIGQNPQHALEKVQAWAHDHNRQAALA
jgi:hypothetical protein